MNVTEVHIRRIFTRDKDPQLRAIVSITIDDALAVHDIRVYEHEGKLHMAMPNTVTKTNKRRDIVHPIGAEARKIIEDAIMAAYAERTAIPET